MTGGGCGHENPDGAKFCTECGLPLVRTCPACATPVVAGQKFCGECGASLTGSGLTASPASAPVQPAPPEPLARRILGERRELEGERKHVTVLFADVSGSMDLAEGVGADEWAQIMDRFFALLTEGVHRYDGTVDKFTGDGVMALFGAPVAYEDHARRACHAALGLVESVGAYAAELRQNQGLAFHVRVGLNSGEVVVGRIGDDARMEYTALGHTVGLAQRMESLAEPGTAYVTEHTARLVTGAFRLRDLGPCAVKGASEPVRVHVLEGTALRRRGLSRWPGRAPLVGRTVELADLEAALAHALDGQAQVVGVVGEPGVGKSRLCEEFVRSVAERGVAVRRASGLSHARGVLLLPILELLRDYHGITETDTPRAAREKIAGRLLLLDPALAQDLPLMFDFLEVPDPDRPAPRLTGEVRLQRVLDIVRRVSRRRSEGEAIVFLLEDLHWFDEQSAAFLGEMIRLFPGTRTLVVANFRPEFSADWMRQSYYRQLPLAPLSAAAVGELLGRLLGADPSLGSLVPHVVESTAGNPFFVEEVVRALVEDGALAGDPGAYCLTRPLGELRVPATVQATLAARIDRLSEHDKAVLQTASVIGRTFSEPDPARQDERAALIASHFQAAGDHWGAARWNARAAVWAMRTSVAEGIGRWRAAIDHLDHVEPTEEALRLGVRARGSLLRLGGRQGMATEEAEALMADGREQAEELGDPGLVGFFVAMAAVSVDYRGDITRAYQLAREGAGLAERSADGDLLAATAMTLAHLSMQKGAVGEGLLRVERTVQMCDGDPQRGAAVMGYSVLARMLFTRAELGCLAGDLEAARSDQDSGIAMARELGQTDLVGWALPFYGFLDWLSGSEEGALDHARQACRIGDETGNASTLIFGLQAQAMTEAMAGRPEDAVDSLGRALAIGRERNIRLYEASVLAHLAWVRLDLGEVAQGIADEAVNLAQRQGTQAFACFALLTRARVRRVAGEAEAALDDLDATVALMKETGAVVYEPFIAEERARVTGDREALVAAAGGYRAIGATGHARRLAAELGLEEV